MNNSKMFFLLFALVLSGCGGMSTKECLEADWRQIGYTDAIEGKINQTASHNESCSEAGVAVDEPLYSEGRAAGLVEFCTYENGEIWGLRSKRYTSGCPGESHDEFMASYLLAYEVAEREAQYDMNRSELSSIKKRLSADDISSVEKSILDKARKLAVVNEYSAKRKYEEAQLSLDVAKIDRSIALAQEEKSREGISAEELQELDERLAELNKERAAVIDAAN